MGGLYRIRNKFVSGLEPTSLDYTNDYRFYARRRMLLHAKRQICELTRRIETEWRVAKFGCVDKVGVEIFSEVKQVNLQIETEYKSGKKIFAPTLRV